MDVHPPRPLSAHPVGVDPLEGVDPSARATKKRYFAIFQILSPPAQ